MSSGTQDRASRWKTNIADNCRQWRGPMQDVRWVAEGRRIQREAHGRARWGRGQWCSCFLRQRSVSQCSPGWLELAIPLPHSPARCTLMDTFTQTHPQIYIQRHMHTQRLQTAPTPKLHRHTAAPTGLPQKPRKQRGCSFTGFPPLHLGHFPAPSRAWEPACDLHSCGWDHASGIRKQLVQLPALESKRGC
jgi:hypothetical protein